MRWWLLLPVCLACCCLANCGSPDQGLRSASSGFTLSVWPESFLGAPPAGRFVLDVDQGDGRAEVSVRVEGARNLRALYLDVDYDPLLWHPVVASASVALGRPGESLELPYFAQPGRASYGQVLIHADERAGLTGDAQLVTLSFAPGPAPEGSLRTAAAGPPAGNGAAPQLFWDSQLEPVLRSRWGGPGDYDQNGEVNISDLTPLGLHFMKSGWFDPLSQLAAVDGDGNGEINLADISVIGQHYSEQVEGYNVYAVSESTAQASGFKSAAAPVMTMMGSITEAAGDQRQMQFSIARDIGTGMAEPPELQSVLWHGSGRYFFGTPDDTESAVLLYIVPFAGAEEGVGSNPVGGPLPEVQLEFDPPVTGTGTRGDPFVIGALVDEHLIRMKHAVDGDVTAQLIEEIVFTTRPCFDMNGSVLPDYQALEIEAQPEVPAWRLSRLSEPLQCDTLISLQDKDAFNGYGIDDDFYFHIAAEIGLNRPPVAVLEVDPPVPVQGQPYRLDASGSVDPEGGALTYEFDPEGDGTFEPPTSDPIKELPGITSPTAAAILQITDNLELKATYEIEYVIEPPVAGAPVITLLSPVGDIVLNPGLPVDFNVNLFDDTGLDSCSFSIDPASAASFNPVSVDLNGEQDIDVQTICTPSSELGPGTVTVTCTDSDGNTTTFDVTVTTEQPNQRPFANLSVLPNPTRVGEETLIDASASFDSDGTVEKVRFDLDGDGVFEIERIAPESFEMYHSFPGIGTVTVKVEVEDDKGATGFVPAQLGVQVDAPLVWDTQVVCGGGGEDMGKHCSMSRVGPYPAIGFYNVGDQDVSYIAALDDQGNQWGFAPAVVSTTPGVVDGLHCAIAPVAGGQPPMILYYDETNKNLMSVRAILENGINWLAPVVVDGLTSDVGTGVSQVMLGGKPAATYYGEGQLWFVTAVDAGSQTWNTPIPLGGGTEAVDATSDLTLVGGVPRAIGMFNDGVEMYNAVDETADTWVSSNVSVAAIGGASTLLHQFPGIASDAVAYASSGGSDELVMEFPVAGDLADWTGTPSVAGVVGESPTRIDGGLYGATIWATAHYIIAVGSDDGLTIYESKDDTGQEWKEPFVLDASANAGAEGLSMSWVFGFRPTICWYAPATGELKFAILRPAS